MVRYENSDILVFQTGHHCLYVFHGNGIHTCKWFIQQNKFWIYCQGTGNFSSPSFTAAEGVTIIFTNMV